MGGIDDDTINLDSYDYESISESQTPDEVKEAKAAGQLWDERGKTGKKKAVHRVVVGSIYTLWGFATIILFVRLCHVVLPFEYQWLLVYEVQTLDNFLFSGIVGSLLAKYGEKILDH